jgi:hypothetical protein
MCAHCDYQIGMSALTAEGLHSLPQEAVLTIANDNLKVYLFIFSSSIFQTHDCSSAFIPAHVPNSLITALASPTTFPATFTNW